MQELNIKEKYHSYIKINEDLDWFHIDLSQINLIDSKDFSDLKIKNNKEINRLENEKLNKEEVLRKFLETEFLEIEDSSGDIEDNNALKNKLDNNIDLIIDAVISDHVRSRAKIVYLEDFDGVLLILRDLIKKKDEDEEEYYDFASIRLLIKDGLIFTVSKEKTNALIELEKVIEKYKQKIKFFSKNIKEKNKTKKSKNLKSFQNALNKNGKLKSIKEDNFIEDVENKFNEMDFILHLIENINESFEEYALDLEDELEELEEILTLFQEKYFEKKEGFYFLKKFFNKKINKNKSNDKYNQIIEKTLKNLDEEEKEYKNIQEIETRLINIKSEATLFKRYLLPQKEALNLLKNSADELNIIFNNKEFLVKNNENYKESIEDSKQLIKENINELIDVNIRIIEDLDRVKDFSNHLKEEITVINNNKLNNNLYMLSIISAIFMPLTFLSGLYGINVKGIPLAENEIGFWLFTLFLIFVCLFQIFIFKWKKWF